MSKPKSAAVVEKTPANPHAQRKLDKTKHYGEIWGRDDKIPASARYQQNGLYFDHDGNCLGGDYAPADVHDEKRDMQEELNAKDDEIAELKRRLAAQGGELPADQASDKAAAATVAEQPAELNEEELDREAIIAQLKQLNVTYPKKATTKELYGILQTEIDSKQS